MSPTRDKEKENTAQNEDRNGNRQKWGSRLALDSRHRLLLKLQDKGRPPSRNRNFTLCLNW